MEELFVDFVVLGGLGVDFGDAMQILLDKSLETRKLATFVMDLVIESPKKTNMDNIIR